MARLAVHCAVRVQHQAGCPQVVAYEILYHTVAVHGNPFAAGEIVFRDHRVAAALGQGRGVNFRPSWVHLVFGQSGPLPEMTLVKLLMNNEQTIGVCQGHGVDLTSTSFAGS